MGAALVLLLVALGAMAAGVLIGRYYVPDDRQLRRTARHMSYVTALCFATLEKTIRATRPQLPIRSISWTPVVAAMNG